MFLIQMGTVLELELCLAATGEKRMSACSDVATGKAVIKL